MKNVAISCVGKLKEKYFRDAAAEYEKRLSRFCKLSVCEQPDYATPDAVKRESDALLQSFRAGEYRILCDINGELFTSEELGKCVDGAFATGYGTVRFVIGGSCGVDDRVRSAADKRISFGRCTYPHQLMRVILLEQIYRGLGIGAGLPYHK